MSGKPSPDGVQELVLALEELADVDQALSANVPERDRLVAEVTRLGEKRQGLATRMKGLLSEMDADSPGNFGWEGRFGWLLGEFRRQVLSRAANSEPGRDE